MTRAVALFGCLLSFLTLAAVGGGGGTSNPQPDLRPASYEQMEAVLREADRADHVTVTTESVTTAGRSLYLARLCRDPQAATCRILLVGLQHGDEHAGKDALIQLVRDLASDPPSLPADVDLHVMPMVNPDGCAADKRRNAAGVDLNRDHLELSQLETRTIHQVAGRVRPHIAVDCHEFGRDSGDYAARGWIEWPLIMMDHANHPLLPPQIVTAGARWVEAAEQPMADAGFNYCRYYVGDAPPDGELRHSTLECDDCRNGLGALGIVSFIIESGVMRGAADPHADLGVRVAAYRRLIGVFLENADLRKATVEAVRLASDEEPPPFVPVNTFWGSNALEVTPVRVIEAATSKTLEIPVANFMGQRVVKKSVPAPQAYAVTPAGAAAFGSLLSRHALPATTVTSTEIVHGERSTLVRIEKAPDSLYNRYAGRAIVETSPTGEMQLPAGSLMIDLAGLSPIDRRRAAILLEPATLYGLYQFPAFAATVGPAGELPVVRLPRRKP